MLKLALICFIVSLIAGFVGFSGISTATAGITQGLFVIALAVFIICVVLASLKNGAGLS